MTYNQEASGTIFRLRQELKERNEDVHKAATFGKELLEKTEKLSAELERVQSENEVLKQEKYSLQLDLDVKVETVDTQSSELEIQREQYDYALKQLEGLHAESITLKQQVSNFKRGNLDFEKAQEDLQRENCTLKNKICSLEQQVQGLQLKVQTSAYLSVVEEESHMEYDVEYYKCQNKKLNEALSELKHDLELAKLEENRLINVVKDLEENVYDRDKELAVYSVEIQKAKDYATELQGEVELLKLEQLDVNRRGNSVFSEIDDRRKLIEKEYKLLMKRYENLGARYQRMKKELLSSKGQMAILFSMTSRGHQDSYIEKLEDQLSSTKRDVERLVAKLDAMTRSLQQNRQDQHFVGSGEYDYLIAMNEQAECKIKKLENELLTVYMQRKADSDELQQRTQEKYAVQKELNAANIEIMKLKNQIKEITLTAETEVSAVSEADILVREFDPNKMAVSKPKQSSSTLVQEVSEKDSNITMGATCSQAQINEIQPISSNTETSKSILQELNENLTNGTCINAENGAKDIKADLYAYLDSSKQNYRTSSNRQDRKNGQCAQQ